MRFVCFAFMSCFLLFFAAQPAFSQGASVDVMAPEAPKKGVSDYIKGFGKTISRPKPYDPKGPYLRDSITFHNNQWDDVDWRPEYWVEDKGSIEAVIDGFYDGGIIVGQYEDNNVPVLEVGKPFLRLSPLDQRHVVEFVDYAFNVTKKHVHGVYYIVIEGEDEQKFLGLYSANGLQLQ